MISVFSLIFSITAHGVLLSTLSYKAVTVSQTMGVLQMTFSNRIFSFLSLKLNLSDKDGPLSTDIIIVLIADEIIKADQTA